MVAVNIRLSERQHQETLDALAGIRGEIRDGLEKVALAISNLQEPEPPPAQEERVKIVARYKFDEDQEPVNFKIFARGGKSAKGTEVGMGDGSARPSVVSKGEGV